jgi:hypothetical protein
MNSFLHSTGRTVYDPRDFNRLCFSFFLTLSYSSKVNAILCPQGVSLPLKKHPDLSARCLVMAVWRHQIFKKRRNGHFYMQRGLLHPTRSLSRIDCRRKDGPKGCKGTSKTILGLGFFKKLISPQETGRRL